MDGRCRLNDPGKRKKRKKRKKKKRAARFDFLVRGNSLEEIFEGGGGGAKKQVELIRLFASRETFRE